MLLAALCVAVALPVAMLLRLAVASALVSLIDDVVCSLARRRGAVS